MERVGWNDANLLLQFVPVRHWDVMPRAPFLHVILTAPIPPRPGHSHAAAEPDGAGSESIRVPAARLDSLISEAWHGPSPASSTRAVGQLRGTERHDHPVPWHRLTGGTDAHAARILRLGAAVHGHQPCGCSAAHIHSRADCRTHELKCVSCTGCCISWRHAHSLAMPTDPSFVVQMTSTPPEILAVLLNVTTMQAQLLVGCAGVKGALIACE